MKLGLWLEPRAAVSSEVYRKNPELFLMPPKEAVPEMLAADGDLATTKWAQMFVNTIAHQGLLDLSQQPARALFEGQLEDLIRLGADWIWFDLNIDPRVAVWNGHEAEGRKGMLELGFYQGLYRVFDTVLRRHPNVWLESCAGGGRIIDLGMLRRSHSIWVNDSSLDDDVNRNLRGGANLLLPAVYIQSGLFLNEEVLSDPVAPGTALGGSHRFLTHFGGMFQFGQGLCYWSESDIRDARHHVDVFKSYRRYFSGDYYRLLPMPQNRAVWDGWQYHEPMTDSGIVVIFRLKDSAAAEQRVRPSGVRTLQYYHWEVVLGDALVSPQDTEISVTMGSSNATLLHYYRKPEVG
jgi:alpha-galactosidase